MDSHLITLTEILKTYGTKYVNKVPQLYYCVKLLESKEGRTMLINSPSLRATFSRITDSILDTPELEDLLDDDLRARYYEIITYWKQGGSRTIFSAEDLY